MNNYKKRAQSSKAINFPCIMAEYASAHTSYSYDYFCDLFSKHEDNWLNYLLRTALPSEYTFDGLKEVCIRDESETEIDLVAVFWFLEDGRCLTTACQFSAKCSGDEISFEYSIIPEKLFGRLDTSSASICQTLTEIQWPTFTKDKITL